MEKTTSTLISLEQNPGIVRVFQDKQWIGFNGLTVPEEMKDRYSYYFLRADGMSFEEFCRAETKWQRSRSKPDRVVGYWYPGAESHPSRKLVEAKPETFERGGYTWTKCDSRSTPVGLLAVAGGDWAYAYANVDISTGYTGWGSGVPADYFPNSDIIGYRILEKDELRPPRAIKPVKAAAATFEQDGYRWTRIHDMSKMPAGLAGVKAGDWMTIDQEGGSSVRDASPEKSMYWANFECWNFTAYCVPSRDKLEDKPAVERINVKVPVETTQAQMIEAAEAKKKDQRDREATAAMIDRDGKPLSAAEKHDKLVQQLVGDGNIFAPPKREVPNLYRIAPITGTGMSLWGAEHLKE